MDRKWNLDWIEMVIKRCLHWIAMDRKRNLD